MQIDTKLTHSSEKFRQSLSVKFYVIKDLNFLMLELKQRKISVSLKLCHVLLKQPAANVFIFR